METAELKKRIREKVEEGALGAADIPDYLQVFCAIGNSAAAAQEEVEGWSCRLRLVLGSAGEHWITVAGGSFETGPGGLADADVTLTMDAPLAAQVFAGEKDAKAAYLAGGSR